MSWAEAKWVADNIRPGVKESVFANSYYNGVYPRNKFLTNVSNGASFSATSSGEKDVPELIVYGSGYITDVNFYISAHSSYRGNSSITGSVLLMIDDLHTIGIPETTISPNSFTDVESKTTLDVNVSYDSEESEFDFDEGFASQKTSGIITLNGPIKFERKIRIFGHAIFSVSGTATNYNGGIVSYNVTYILLDNGGGGGVSN